MGICSQQPLYLWKGEGAFFAWIPCESVTLMGVVTFRVGDAHRSWKTLVCFGGRGVRGEQKQSGAARSSMVNRTSRFPNVTGYLEGYSCAASVWKPLPQTADKDLLTLYSLRRIINSVCSAVQGP